jgi:hypothetical protein
MQPNLPLARYQLSFHSKDTRPAPRFAGSAWRGALGHALRHSACITGAPHCEGCPRLHDCAYSYLFATPVPPDASKMTRYSEAPHPYVLLEHPAPAGQVILGLTLFGHAQNHAPLMLLALTRAAQGQQGIAGRRLELQHLEQWQPDTGTWQRRDSRHDSVQLKAAHTLTVPPVPAAPIYLDILTPLRVRREGKHVTPANFTFADLFSSLLRRISLLTNFHTDTPLDTDFRTLTQDARQIEIQSTLHWLDLERHSSRQNTDMTLGGVVGNLIIPHENLAPFWPYLWLGQYTHAGRATTMGLGCYRIRPASLPMPPTS